MEPSSQPRELSISWKSVQYTLLLSRHAHECLSPTFDEFKSSVLFSIEELDQPSHPLEILALFLDHLQGVLLSKRCHRSSSHQEFIREVLDAVERDVIADKEIHGVVAAIDASNERKRAILAAYYNVAAYTSYQHRSHEPLLWKPSGEERFGICSIFTGQGNSNADALNDLRDHWRTYKPLLRDLINSTASLLLELSKSADAAPFYENEDFDLEKWLEDEEASPNLERISSAPISFPIIGLLNLANFCIMCKVAGISPGGAIATMQAVTGHSQGVVVAACVAKAKTWEDFYVAARLSLEILFWIGYDSHEDAPETNLSGQQIQESIDNGENIPSPMLSITGLPRQKVEILVQNANKHLPKEQQVFVALVNSRENLVLSGPPRSLRGIAVHVRTLKVSKGLDQGRIPYNLRKPELSAQFLPISAPFHSAYLANATERVVARLASAVLLGRELGTAVISTANGADLREEGDCNIIPSLVRMVTCQLVDWPAVCALPGATHVIEFGTGQFSNLLSQVMEGTGARIIAAGSLRLSDGSIGSKSELFDARVSPSPRSSQSWEEEFGPRLRKIASGEVVVETKFSRFLNMPPILVAGMTPTTVPSDFVAAITNAGYYVELAGGGYFNKEAFRKAILDVASSTQPGQGLAINLIYASPRAIAWQVPLVGQLIREGVPIDGLTIGAGVPSTEVAHGYITNIGLKYIGFKPGSVESIRQVIDIANAHRDFPIIMQWTGGRGGGHHSFEDFHSPMLQAYGRIRRCPNIILVAGSGFGDAEDSYPYLNGTWAKSFGYPPMPFDAILLGSRMMVAKEAHTSLQAKKAIVEAEGVSDANWVGSYERATGGVVTVLSEMGQPIHKLATRGVLFWSELDKMIFNLQGPKRLAALEANKEYIVQKLNADSAKVWFPKVSSEEIVELEDMTYHEVLLRLIELMYVAKQNRWIDTSYKIIVLDFVYRIHERFAFGEDPNHYDMDSPFTLANDVAREVPECRNQLLSPEDANFFLSICKRPGRKPVNFVPRLDDDFEHYFKKDSLWQSEDVDAVVDQDVGRVCILQGPVAAHYSKTIDEPASDILNAMNKAFVRKLEGDTSGNLHNARLSLMSGGKVDSPLENAQVEISERRMRLTLDGRGDLPDRQVWWAFISSHVTGWVREVFDVDYILQGRTKVANPIRTFFNPQHGMVLVIEFPVKGGDYQLTLLKRADGAAAYEQAVSMTSPDGYTLLVDVFEHRARGGSAARLPLRFHYDLTNANHPISEIMHDRNSRIKSFYSALWFGKPLPDVHHSTNQSTFTGNPVTLTKESVSQFSRSVGGKSQHAQDSNPEPPVVPMDAAILAAWEVLMKPLLSPEIEGDLLRLVHRSNTFNYVSGASPLKTGDVLHSTSCIKGIFIEESGKVVEVLAVIKRDEKPVMEVFSTFLFKGDYQDFETTYKDVRESAFTFRAQSTKFQALLRDREWLILDQDVADLNGNSLRFEPVSRYTYSGKNIIKSLQVSGIIFLTSPSERLREIGSIHYEVGKCSGNPVTDFLERWGTKTNEMTQLQNPSYVDQNEALIFKTPRSNELYGRASGDYNPIHVSEMFATYASLPGTVTHGMYTSAVVRSMTEKWMAGGDTRRFQRWKASFVGMVLPGDNLRVRLSHIGALKGRQIVKVTVDNETSGDTVLQGEAEIGEPNTAYVFSGQGSQSKGMGMDLYATSAVAREVWDKADKYMLENYGWSPLEVVRNNPISLTIHFGGKRGRRIRENYLSMKTEHTGLDGTTYSEPLLRDIKPNSTSYKFMHPFGLLFLTQFAQPTLTLLEKATFADMKAKGLIQEGAQFAGHSLGEYGALGSMTDFMPIEKFVSLSYYRGLTMSLVMERDEHGRTEYSMMAVNPSRVMKGFDETALKYVVESIAQQTGLLLEIVNYNIEGQQYVCAGHLKTLHILSTVLTQLSAATHLVSSTATTPVSLLPLLTPLLASAHTLPQPVTLARTQSCVPLSGIDIPFHSSLLRSSVPAFRHFLNKQIDVNDVEPEQLVGRYVPNLTAGEPKASDGDEKEDEKSGVFDLSREYVESVLRVTGSEVLRNVLDEWDEYEGALGEDQGLAIGAGREVDAVA